MKPTDLVSDDRLRKLANGDPAPIPPLSFMEIAEEHVAMAHELLSARQALKLREHGEIARCATALERIADALEGATKFADAAEKQS